MEENKEHTEHENFDEKAENLKEKAEDLAKDAKSKAETFAGKAMDAAENLVNELLGKKNKNEVSASAESEDTEDLPTDPKDIEIIELKKEMEELRDKYVRMYADFDNFKKRNARERLELIQVAGKDVITGLLPVLDDFERAIKVLEKAEDKSALEGMQLIHNKLLNNLAAKGLKAMESVGKDFDVDQHEAITEIPAGPEMGGKVIDEVEKGYYLNDKIIRFAKVVVGKREE